MRGWSLMRPLIAASESAMDHGPWEPVLLHAVRLAGVPFPLCLCRPHLPVVSVVGPGVCNAPPPPPTHAPCVGAPPSPQTCPSSRKVPMCLLSGPRPQRRDARRPRPDPMPRTVSPSLRPRRASDVCIGPVQQRASARRRGQEQRRPSLGLHSTMQ